MSVVWPVTLPTAPLVAGFEESPPDLCVRTQMDAGPAKVRKRYTAGVRDFSAAFVLTTAQLAIFDAFYLTTCNGGATPFDFTHPRTKASISVRFAGRPKYASASTTRWHVSVPLEVLP